MSEIDWDKAPEGATHCLAWKDEAHGEFYIDSGGDRLMNADLSGCYVMRQDLHLWNVFPRPSPAWSGEGLPPVGVRCEAAIPHTSGSDNERSFIWIEGSVIAYYEIKGKTFAWFAEDDGFYPPNALEFRPIRTPEQIAADEREAAIHEIAVAMAWHPTRSAKSLAAMVYDAGYRKQADQ